MDWLLPSQESSASRMKKCLKLWLTNLMNGPERTFTDCRSLRILELLISQICLIDLKYF